MDSSEENSYKLIAFINKLKESYSNRNLNINSYNIHKNDRYDDDIALFRTIFDRDSYIEDISHWSTSDITGFTLKDTNGLKVQFEKRRTENYFDYEITIIGIFDNYNLNILDEIGLDINLDDTKYLKKFFEDMIEEQLYFSIYGGEICRFYLNDSAYITATTDSGSLEVFYGADGKDELKRLDIDMVPTFIEENYDLEKKIGGKINKALKFDLFKDTDELISQLKKYRNNYDGEQILRLINEKNIKNQELINYAVEDMLDEKGFYSNIPERIDTSFIEKDYYLNDIIMHDYQIMKEKISKFDNKMIEKGFKFATEIDENNYNYDTPKSNIALIINKQKGNSGKIFKNILGNLCCRYDYELFRNYYSRKQHQMMIINEDVSHDIKCNYINDYFKQYVEVKEGKLENFLFAPYYLNRYIIPEIKNIALNIGKMLENDTFKERFSKEYGIEIVYSIKRKCEYLVSNDFGDGEISFPELKAFMNDGIKVARKVTEIKNDVIGSCNDLKFALMDLKDDTEKEIKLCEAEIKRIFFKRNKIQYYDRIKELKINLEKQQDDTERRIKDLKDIKKDCFFGEITSEYFRLFPQYYRTYMSLNFVETPITCLITRDHTGIDRFKLDFKNNKWCAIDSYYGNVISCNLIDYATHAMNNDFDSISDEDSQAVVIRNYYDKASKCCNIDELITLIKTEYDKNFDNEKKLKLEKY